MAMITTTLNRIRAHGPCQPGWRKLLAHLGKTQPDDEPLPYAVIVAANGLDDALWCCRAEPQYAREWRLYAVWCARRMQHLMAVARFPAAIDAAERISLGLTRASELNLTIGGLRSYLKGDYGLSILKNALHPDAWEAARWTPFFCLEQTEAAGRAAENEAQTAEFLRIVGT
jgi:hypothetical protein